MSNILKVNRKDTRRVPGSELKGELGLKLTIAILLTLNLIHPLFNCQYC